MDLTTAWKFDWKSIKKVEIHHDFRYAKNQQTRLMRTSNHARSAQGHTIART